ncbi:M48 family metallopeptidase [Spirulina major CS-329]|uniref:M48 family metallopeptidase n=1 Tax=Spirulina TaxID=1154 RepID=UPI00232EAE3C|nr:MULTISPECIES: M48 family metallopeptidase [Spirulina]MDB9494192.1 M48 family metallopeptidase [Spirulina subsalsa CS-330]MDB9505309.1 M48 family metallopeptidase [Spirulina major CS-329]
MAPKQSLIGLKASQFRHPLDQDATQSLQQVPGLDIAIRTMLGPVVEEFMFINNVAATVQVGPQQLPQLHDLLLEACAILDVESPQLYVKQHPTPNAYTLAMRGKRPFIVIHTALIDLLTWEEVQAVIAHELGHLKCEHGVYMTLANVMVLAASIVPTWGALLTQALQDRMLAWSRCAELSCDRAALLACQNPDVVMSVLMKLAGGSPRLAPMLNLDAFVAQARDYDAIATHELGHLLRSAQVQQLTHPFPVLRAREVQRWAQSSDYQALLESNRGGYNGKASNTGEWRNW